MRRVILQTIQGTYRCRCFEVTLKGPTLGILSPSLAEQAGLPVVFLSYGQSVWQYDAFGNLTSVSLNNGTAQDVCQMLQ
jgi:hypothetical protein